MADSEESSCLSGKKVELYYELRHGRKMPKTAWRKLLYAFMDFVMCCCYIPCPPFPSCIISKFAFLPPQPTYKFVQTNKLFNDKIPIFKFKYNLGCEILINVELNKMISTKRIKNVKCFYIHPSHTKQIACYYLKWSSKQNSSFVVLRCHANASDLGAQLQFNLYLSWRLCCDVFEFDYCGYGMSTGKPSESTLYNDVSCAYQFLTKDLMINPKRIVIFGQSIGTVAAIHLASSKVPVNGLILDGVLMSAFRILCPESRKKLICDEFQSAKKVPLIECPTLLIHGGRDCITHFEHAEYFFELCKTLVPPLIIPTGDHNCLNSYRAYWNRLEIFFGLELGGGSMPYSNACGYGCSLIHIEETDSDKDDLGFKHMQLYWPFEQI